MAETTDFRQALTDRLIEQLEAGVAPWQKPWDALEQLALPYNPTTGKSYRGANSLYLSLVSSAKGYADPRWATYRQAADRDWQVRKGEKGVQIEYWKFSEEKPLKDDSGKPLLDESGEPKVTFILLEKPKVFRATVFNASQMDNVPELEPGPRMYEWDPLERAESILTNSGASLHHDQRDRAYYSPGADQIHLPSREQFLNASAYYGTALHELGHWTGHRTRLDRDLTHPFGSAEYAREELRAELASYFLADRLGIPHDPGQHAAYVQSWISALREDRNEIFRASRDADRIADFVLTLDRNRELDKEPTRTAEADRPAPLPDNKDRRAPSSHSSGDKIMPNDILSEAAVYEVQPALESAPLVSPSVLQRIMERQRQADDEAHDVRNATKWAAADAADFYLVPTEQAEQAVALFRQNGNRFAHYRTALQEQDPGITVRLNSIDTPTPPRGMADFEAEIGSIVAHRAIDPISELNENNPLAPETPWSQDDLSLANDLLIEDGEQWRSLQGNTTDSQTEPHMGGIPTQPVTTEVVAEATPSVPSTESEKPKRKKATKTKEVEPPNPVTESVGLANLDAYATGRLDRVTASRAEDFEKARKQLDAEAMARAKIHLLQDPAGRHIVAIDHGGLTKAYAVGNSPGIAATTANKLRESIRSISNRISETSLLPDVIKTRFRLKSGEQKVVYNVDPEGIDPRHSIMRDAGQGENDRRNLVVTPEGNATDSMKRILVSNELPEDIRKRFVHSDNVPGQYFDRNNRLAFIDKGNRLATDQNAIEIVTSMISMVQAKGWKSITLKGHEDFRREAWLSASLAGLEVSGFKPSEADLAKLDSERQLRMGNAIQPSVLTTPLSVNGITVREPEAPLPLGANAVALGEAARFKGVREDQVPNFMRAAQAFLDEAKKAGVEIPALKVFDPQAPAIPSPDKTESQTVGLEREQPSPKIKR